MPEHVVKRGLDIPIKGRATGAAVAIDPPATIAYAPTELGGIVPRLTLREGDPVKAGQTLFFDKSNPDLVFRSPIAGRLKEIRRGARRVITDIVVERGGEAEERFPVRDLGQIKAMSRTEALQALLASGSWATIRTRPLDDVADPATAPQSVVICASDSGPLMPSAAELLADSDRDALQAAVYALKACTDGPVFVTEHLGAGGSHKALAGLEGAQLHGFRGPHPSGDAAVQVNLLDPPRGQGRVWYLQAWDAVAIGRFLLEGRFVAERVYAAVGAGVQQPRLVRTVLGAPLAHIVGEVGAGEQRWIRGSVLTGEAVDGARWASFLRRAVHVLPEEVPQYVLGWALPSLGRWSKHRAFLSGMFGAGGEHDLRPGVNGGVRTLIPIGYYNDVVVTPDVLPEFLFRSIQAGDVVEAMSLGLLDLTREEAALCTYICPSKVEFGTLLGEGLAQYRSEA